MNTPKTFHKVIIGDCRQMDIADNSTHLVITSPPYWQLKDYGDKSQIGFNDSYEDYINHLGVVWAECYRVLEAGCRLCINIGDQFARAAYYGRYKVIPIKSEIIKCCESLGFDYMGTIIWQKTTTSNASGGGSVMGSYPYPRNGIIKFDYESILIFKKNGVPPRRKISQQIKEQSKMSAQEWNLYFSGHWNFKGARQDKHLAMFPPELPSRLIKMFSFVGDTVLDPFLGSGTTSLSAINLGRNSIGYEINTDFKDIIRCKLDESQNLLTSNSEIDFVEKKSSLDNGELQRKIAHLPYVFRDTVLLKREVDPKKFSFGSKIDGNGSGQSEKNFYYIRRIISPIKLQLSNGTHIRLLGVQPIKKRESAAMAFIHKKTNGKKVLMKFDNHTHDKDGSLLCYLYLENKTFINAHLIKHGLASPDLELEHHYLNKFIKYGEIGNESQSSGI